MRARLTPCLPLYNDLSFRIYGILVTDMEFRDLRYFAAVAEHHNIGRAAEALNLSATALGKSLRRLEKSVGAKLVQRAPKGVALTAVGAALLTRIGPLQGMLNDVRHEAADLAQAHTGHINVGSTPSTAENFLADACVALSRESSRITLKVTVASAASLGNTLHKGEMDFCVADVEAFSPADYVQESLCSNQEVVFASANHRLAKRKQVSVADLASERWASNVGTSRPPWQALFQAFKNKGLAPPSLALDTNSQAVRIQAIAYSDYVGVNTRQFVRQEARRFPLVELPVKEMSVVRDLSIIYRKGAYLSPAARRLIDILQQQAKKSSDSARSGRRSMRGT